MRYTIKGITNQTISFNSLGITIRGNSNDMKLFPHSIAYHVDVKTEPQLNEVHAMVKAGYIQLDCEQNKTVKPSKREIVSVPKIKRSPIKLAIASKIAQEQESVDDNVLKTSSELAVKKTQNIKIPKKTKAKKEAKVIKRVVGSETESLGDEVTIVTSDGKVVKGRSLRSDNGALDNSPAVSESLKAMAILEEEERLRELADDQDDQDDQNEEKYSISDRMGSDIVVASGEGKPIKAKMRNNSAGESIQSKKASKKINWVDLGDKESQAKKDLSAKHSFVDKDDKKDEDKEIGDQFIE